MQFGNLQFLWLLWLVPAAALFIYYAFKRKRAVLERFSQKELLKNLTANVSVRKQKFKALMLIAALFFVIAALLNPKWGYHWEEVKRKGIDIVIALDISRSMLAQDAKPDRFQMAKREIEDFINVLRGDRVALVVFSGVSFVQCPLTLDYGAFKMFLNDVNTKSVPVGGTDISSAIRTAINAFRDKLTKNKIVILITDGEDHGAGMQRAVEEAKKDGVVLYTVGIGSPAGAPIPVTDENGLKTFLKDKSGNVILSKPDEAALKKAAFETGGAYLSAAGGGIGLEKLYTEKISKLEKKEFEAAKKKVYESRFQVPLFFAFILLLIEAVMGDKKRSD